MSGKATGQVWELELTTPQLVVMLALADRADQFGTNIYPGMRLVAWMTGYSERQVRRIVKELLDSNLLEKVKDRPGKSSIYRINFDKGVQKPAFVEDINTNADVQNVPVGTDITPDIAVSYDTAMSPLTSHGKNEKATPDMASLILSRNGNKDERLKEEESTRDSTPVPFHIANGMGMVQKPKNNVNVDRAKAHPVWQAYVRGWDGIEPDLPASTIDITLTALDELQKGINANQYTLTDIETLTRKKLSEPRAKTYLLIYLKSDLPAYIKSEQARRQREQIVTAQNRVPEEWGVNHFVRQVKQ